MDAISALHQPVTGALQPMLDAIDPPVTEEMMNGLRARTVLDGLPDAILIANTMGVVQYLNRAAVQLLGVACAEACGRPVHEILKLKDGATGQPIIPPLSYLLAGTDSRYAHLVRRDGSAIPIDCSISTIHANRHLPAGLVLTLRDASRPNARIEQSGEAKRRDEHSQLLRRGELERRLACLLKNMDNGDSHALLFMDLDGFMGVNEYAGQAAGDAVLGEVAALISTQMRDRDILAHLGGDDFGLLLEHCPLVFARKRAEALQAALANRTFKIRDRSIVLGVSIGVVAINYGRDDIETMISAADATWYSAKRLTGVAPRIGEMNLE